MKKVNFKRVMLFMSGLMSYLGIIALLSLVLIDTTYELSSQDLKFAYLSIWLCATAFISLLVAGKRLNFSWLDVIVIALYVYTIINYSFVSEVVVASKLLIYSFLVLTYLSLRIITSVHKNILFFTFVVIVFVGLFQGFLGISQALGFERSHSMYKISGTFFNPGPYGGFLNAIISMCTYYVVKNNFLSGLFKLTRFKDIKLQPKRYVYASLYALCCVTLFCCFAIFFAVLSRAAIISYVVCLIVILFTANRSIVKKIKKLFTGRLKYLSITALVFIMLGFASGIYLLKPGSADSRMLIWKVSSDAIAEKPITGVGYGEFFNAYAESIGDFFENNPDSKYLDVANTIEFGFNEYLFFAVEMGVIALCAMLIFFGISLYRLLKVKSPYFYSLFSILIFALFSYPFSILPIAIILLISLVAAAKRRTYVVRKSVALPFAAGWILALFFAVCLFMFPVLKGKVETVKEWQTLRFLYHAEIYDEVNQEYSLFYPQMCDNPRFLFEFGRSLNKSGEYQKSNFILKQGALLSADPMFHNIMGNNYKSLGQYDLAEQQYEYAYRILPNRLYPLYLLFQLYVDTGQKEKALDIGNVILIYTPKIESSATAEMKEKTKEILTTLSDK